MDISYTLVPYFSTKEEAHCTPWLDDPAYLLQSCTLKFLIIMIFRVIFENLAKSTGKVFKILKVS